MQKYGIVNERQGHSLLALLIAKTGIAEMSKLFLFLCGEMPLLSFILVYSTTFIVAMLHCR
jgi:hypothetical protein